MPQEPLKMFQWNRPLALERLQASQHWLSTLLWETCCEVDRVQLHAEKRDPLRRGEFALFPVDLNPQPAEVPEGEGLLVCSPFECKAEKRSVSREDRDIEVGVLQVDRCKPIEGTDALKDASLRQHPERELENVTSVFWPGGPAGGPWHAGRKRPVQQHRKPWPLERTRTYRPWTEGVGLPLQAAAPCGHSCMAMAHSTGGILTYPWAAPLSRVVRTEEALGLFRAEKGALQDLVTSSCTSGKKGTGGVCFCSACAPRNQSSSLERSGEGGSL